jgi:hypothetical protein
MRRTRSIITTAIVLVPPRPTAFEAIHQSRRQSFEGRLTAKLGVDRDDDLERIKYPSHEHRTSTRAADVPQPVWPHFWAGNPNIVFILLDNVGREWFGCYGSEEHCTPNIDRLAATGVRVENCYTPPVCGPIRIVLLTGRYPHSTGFRLTTMPHFIAAGASIRNAKFFFRGCSAMPATPLR